MEEHVHRSINAESPAPTSVVVLAPPPSLPSLLTACSTQAMTASYISGRPESSNRREYDRQSNESSSPAPTPSSFIDGNLGPVEDTIPPALSGPGGIVKGSVGENTLPFHIPPGGTNNTSDPLLTSDCGKQALQRLVSRAVPQDELPSVLETIASSVEPANIVECLEGCDAQTFIDAIDEARHHAISSPRNCSTDPHVNLFTSVEQALVILDLTPRIRRKCVKLLYKTCAGRISLPTSLRFELPEEPMGAALRRGGFAEVFKCQQSCGREIAVKVLLPRTYNGSQRMVDVGHRPTYDSLHTIANRVPRSQRFCKEVITWNTLRHPNILPLLGVVMADNRFAMVSEWMTNGNINEFVTTRPCENRFELVSSLFHPRDTFGRR